LLARQTFAAGKDLVDPDMQFWLTSRVEVAVMPFL
jgi:hypothetical protein